jgi:hypothetical protein
MSATTKERIDHALGYVAARMDLIAQAHAQLGSPLEDLVCDCIRRALSERVSDRASLSDSAGSAAPTGRTSP